MHLSTPHYLHSLSSLARYFKKDLRGVSFELIEGSIVDIARVSENISYPGIEGVDAIVYEGDLEAIFSCTDSIRTISHHPFSVMNFFYDKNRNSYIDRSDSYKALREKKLELNTQSNLNMLSIQNLLEAGALVSCFGFKPSSELLSGFGILSERIDSVTILPDQIPSPIIQRLYLSCILSGEFTAAGLKLLKDFSAVEILWPELYSLVGLSQDKEFHPEGDVWDHSLETLYHRKTNDPELSFALLLHDIGKPLSEEEDGNRFNNHAQIGRRAAVNLLKRLEFPPEKIEKISFLVENHMLPAAIKTLPTFRTEKAMQNPWFPLLLEVYRCDLMSSFNGPEGYYEACKVYRRFIKNTKNPFRGSDGKKLYRQYVD